MKPPISVSVLVRDPVIVQTLAEAMVESVADGGSLTFLHPLSLDKAREFWTQSFVFAEQGRLVILGAFDQDQLAGTATLRVDFPEGQPHRAEILKVITRIAYRRRGVAQALLREAERHALEHQRPLLTLEATAGSGASILYERLGYQLTGIVPDGELSSFGDPVDTAIYFKRLG